MSRQSLSIAILLAAAWFAGCAMGPQVAERASPQTTAFQPPAVDSAPVRPASHFQPIEIEPVAPPNVPQQHGLLPAPASADDLVAFAIGNNPEIAAARSRAQALAARCPQVETLPDPVLQTTAFLEDIETAAGPQDVILGLSQKFPWFGKRALRGYAADHEAQAAYAELAALELAIARQVKEAYFDLHYIDRSVEVYRSLDPFLQQLIDAAREDERVGLETVYDAEIERQKLKTTLLVLRQQRTRVEARLRRLLHLPLGEPIVTTGSLRITRIPASSGPLLALMEQCQPRLQAQIQRMLRDETNIELARRDYFPDLNLGVNWHAIGSSGLSPVATGEDAVSLMAGVNLPIYRRRLDAGVWEARSNAAHSARQYEATWDMLAEDIVRLHAIVVEQDQALDILENEIIDRRAAPALDLAFEAWRLHRIGYEQLFRSYQSLLQLRLQRHERRVKREKAAAALEQAVGCTLTWLPLDEVDVAPAR